MIYYFVLNGELAGSSPELWSDFVTKQLDPTDAEQIEDDTWRLPTQRYSSLYALNDSCGRLSQHITLLAHIGSVTKSAVHI